MAPTGPTWDAPNDQAQNPQGNPQNQFQMSPEEAAFVKELSSQAFWQRGLPLSMGAMAGAAWMVKSGKWAAHPKFGPVPKVALAGSIAYFIGKMSYIPVMQQKILNEIPNSNLAAQIRKSKRLPNPNEHDGLSGFGAEPSAQSPRQPKAIDDYSSFGSSNSGLDDRFRPSIDREVKHEDKPEEKAAITYEDLRRRNRAQYDDELRKSHQDGSVRPSYKDSPFMPQKPFPPPGPDMYREPNKEPGPSIQDPPPPPPKKKTNMWGDEI